MITCREASLVFKLAQYLAHGQTPSALPKADDDADRRSDYQSKFCKEQN